PRPIRQINPEVPAWLEAIVARLLAKDPARRYRSASEVADLLGRCLAHVQQPLAVPLPAEVAPRAGRARPARARGLAAWARGLGLAAAAGAALVPAWWPRPRRLPNPPAGPVAPDRSAPERSRPARAGADEIAELFQATLGRAGALQSDLQRGGAAL